MPIVADLPPIPSSAIFDDITRRPAIVLRHTDTVSAITPDFNSLTLRDSDASSEDAARERLVSEAIQQLRRYGRFRSGWDGYSGVPFQQRLIESVIRVIELASAIAKLMGGTIDAIIPGPASDGSIDIEFRSSQKTLIVTMYPDAVDAEIYREDAHQAVDSTVRNEPTALVPHLAWLAR